MLFTLFGISLVQLSAGFEDERFLSLGSFHFLDENDSSSDDREKSERATAKIDLNQSSEALRDLGVVTIFTMEQVLELKKNLEKPVMIVISKKIKVPDLAEFLESSWYELSEVSHSFEFWRLKVLLPAESYYSQASETDSPHHQKKRINTRFESSFSLATENEKACNKASEAKTPEPTDEELFWNCYDEDVNF